MYTSDSSEDENENLERFKESVDSQFLKNELYNSIPTSKESETKDHHQQLKQLPSLRRNIHEEDEAFNFFRVTPEFQKYVSKQLAIKLEKVLKQQEVGEHDNQQLTMDIKKRKKGGIKLLHSSKHYIKIAKVCHDTIENDHNIRISRKLNEFNEDELEMKCKVVAVDAEVVLSQKDVRSWSNRSKAKVYIYKKNNGVLECQEKMFVPFKY